VKAFPSASVLAAGGWPCSVAFGRVRGGMCRASVHYRCAGCVYPSRLGRAVPGCVSEQAIDELARDPVHELTGTADDITEQILARLAGSLASEPVQSLALLRSMLTHPEAAQAMREGAARYQAQISGPITADDARLRAALVGAVILGVIVSRHLLRTEALSDASPEHVINLLRPCLPNRNA
jgi:Tetracyclin repressor-like, C-terminal domain